MPGLFSVRRRPQSPPGYIIWLLVAKLSDISRGLLLCLSWRYAILNLSSRVTKRGTGEVILPLCAARGVRRRRWIWDLVLESYAPTPSSCQGGLDLKSICAMIPESCVKGAHGASISWSHGDALSSNSLGDMCLALGPGIGRGSTSFSLHRAVTEPSILPRWEWPTLIKGKRGILVLQRQGTQVPFRIISNRRFRLNIISKHQVVGYFS